MKQSLKTFVILGLTVALLWSTAGSALALDPMRIPIRTALPGKVTTVGQAAQYYADAIGYRLATEYPAPPESGRIAGELLNPLSAVNETRPVAEAIIALLRADYLLVIDHPHKLFSFEERGGQSQ